MQEFPVLSQPVVAQLARFADAATKYCELVERRAGTPSEAFLREAHTQVARLYWEGLNLPSTDLLFPDDGSDAEEDDSVDPPNSDDREGIDNDQWWALYKDLSAMLGPSNHYREVFDPWKADEEEVTGSLADDIADIYRDLHRGLLFWRRDEHANALWEWRFHFEIHWGEHAVGALRAIHLRASTYDAPWPHTEGRAT